MDVCTPPELQNVANIAKNSTLPDKSKNRYIQCYRVFQEWKSSKNCEVITENVILAYFHHLSEKKAPPTLWSIYSMLRKMLDLKDNIKIDQYHSLISFIKNKNKGYVAKQAEVFSEENIANFMQNAPNDIYLATKVRIRVLLKTISVILCNSLNLFSILDCYYFWNTWSL